VSSSLCDEVPHIFIPKSHLEAREILVSSAKRLLQQYLPKADSCTAANSILTINRRDIHQHVREAGVAKDMRNKSLLDRQLNVGPDKRRLATTAN